MFELTSYYSPNLLFFGLFASALAMALSFLSSFYSKKSAAGSEESKPSPVRALPASWYTSQDMYELERRSIFSKRWLLTTHSLRLPNNGDWLRYEIAGFSFVITKDRTGAINAFHNICRHRAFPVVTAEKGNNSILACKYHNWSYALNGKLTKAPGYQELSGFDKSKNSLFPIHVHVDTNGFIWVNLDASDKPTPWNEHFAGIDTQDRFKAYNWDEYKFDHTWEMEGEYNWKILADNYNVSSPKSKRNTMNKKLIRFALQECYHCPTTHPDIPQVANLEAYGVVTEKGYVQHLGRPTPEQIAKGFNVAATYYFPNASMNVS